MKATILSLIFGGNLNLKFVSQIFLIMNNLTHKIFLVFLLVTTTLFSWATDSPKENPSSKKANYVAAIPPAPPGVAYLGFDKCGYSASQFVTGPDPNMQALLRSTGCANGFVQWYDAAGNNLGRNNGTGINANVKFLGVSRDLIVYATCTEFGEESGPSAQLFIQYKSAPSRQPSIFQSDSVVCNGGVITLKSTVNDPRFIYEWQKSKITTKTTVASEKETQGQYLTLKNASGLGTPEIKVTEGGYYYLQVRSPDCPSVIAFGTGQIFVGFNIVPTPKITASDTIFCEDKSVSLKADSNSVVAKYQWFVNGVKQDSLGMSGFIKSFNKTAKIQVQTVDNRLSCISPLSAAVNLKTLRVPAKPTITSSKKDASICQGDSLSLTSSNGFKYKWSNGATTPSIKNITAVGKYTVQVIDTSGCVSKASDTTKIIVFKLPTKPVISANGPLAFCSGSSVILTSTANAVYIWSTKASTRAITVNASGDFTVAVRDTNNCLSPTSDITKVTVYALPAKPTITVTGPLAFCADKSVLLTSSDLVNGEKTRYRWSTSDTTKAITINTANTFTLRVLDPRNCLSPASDPITTKVLPLPSSPTLSADGALTFCARTNEDYTKPTVVNLKAESQNRVTWYRGTADSVGTGTSYVLTGIKNNQFSDISGVYSATATELSTGCISVRSAALTVLVKNNPDATAANIAKDGTFTLKAVNFPDGGDYEWKFGSEVLKFTEASIKANRYGDYTTRRKVIYTVPAPTNTLTCFSNFVTIFNFKEDPDFKGLSIYPNPGNGLLTIETLADYDNPELIIYDLLGRLVYTGTVPSIKGKLIVDLRNQTEGEYFLRFKANGFDLAKRIIIDR
jgi:Secretion system C-terminal sorting domain